MLIVIALFLAAFTNVAVCDPAMQPLIDKICRSTEDYGFCNNVFNENIGAHPKDMKGLGEIAQLQALYNATNTHVFILKLVDTVPPGPVKTVLDECVNAYSVVSNQFQQGLLQFEQGKYQDALDTERITPRAQSSCSSTFSTPPYPKNPLVERNREMRILIAMAITTLLDLTQK